MRLKVNGALIKSPSEFQVTILDLDDSDSSVRTADGTLNRDRITVKRQIDLSWNALRDFEISSILKAMDGVFFDFTYPDPMTGTELTKKMYVGNRPAPLGIEKNGVMWWTGLKITLTER